ncbi:hypothetical protein C9374_010113 [Naegleria lovaniensis]|uniref:RGS domain-containing protein n=1 Tax=Naegleria lovaniensis TaxID=51637 RepID=A0AA88KG78_NAELO|nr:uncharacterized protein C9374_010113 [Naegleria lovaniensis]KAG2375109.1 hypothetical protein C9374_010113 [Naegleria lovaniensis]
MIQPPPHEEKSQLDPNTIMVHIDYLHKNQVDIKASQSVVAENDTKHYEQQHQEEDLKIIIPQSESIPYVFPHPTTTTLEVETSRISSPRASSSLSRLFLKKKKREEAFAPKFNPLNYRVLYEELMQCEAAREHFQHYLKSVHNEEPLLFLNALNEYKQEYARVRAEMTALVHRRSSCYDDASMFSSTTSTVSVSTVLASTPTSKSQFSGPVEEESCSSSRRNSSCPSSPSSPTSPTRLNHHPCKFRLLSQKLHQCSWGNKLHTTTLDEEATIFKRVMLLWEKLNEISDLFIAPSSKYELNLSKKHSEPLVNAFSDIASLLNAIRPFLSIMPSSPSKLSKEKRNSSNSNVAAAILELRRNSEASTRSSHTSASSGSGVSSEDQVVDYEDNIFYSPCRILERMNPDLLFTSIEFQVNLDLSMDQLPRYARSKELFTFLEEKGEDFTRSIALDISKGSHWDIRFKYNDFHSPFITDRDIYFAYMLSKDTPDWEELSFSSHPNLLQTFFSKTSHTIGQEKMKGLRLFKMVLHLPYNIEDVWACYCDVNCRLEVDFNLGDDLRLDDYLSPVLPNTPELLTSTPTTAHNHSNHSPLSLQFGSGTLDPKLPFVKTRFFPFVMTSIKDPHTEGYVVVGHTRSLQDPMGLNINNKEVASSLFHYMLFPLGDHSTRLVHTSYTDFLLPMDSKSIGRAIWKKRCKMLQNGFHKVLKERTMGGTKHVELSRVHDNMKYFQCVKDNSERFKNRSWFLEFESLSNCSNNNNETIT